MLSWNLHSLTNSCELGAVRDACPRPDSLKIYMLYLNVYTGKFSKIIAYNQHFTKKYALLTLKQKLDKCKFRSVYELWIWEWNANLSELSQQVLCNRTPRADRCFRLVYTCSHYFCYILELTTFQSILFEFWDKKPLCTLETCILQAFSESLERLYMLQNVEHEE